MGIDIVIIVIFLVANVLIGTLSSRNISTFERFSVGYRAFSSFVIFATLSASFIGGGFTLGNAAKVFSDGMIYAFALLGFSLKEILVAQIIAPRMNAHYDCLSIGDIVAKGYGAWAQVITGLLGVILCTGVLGAQVGAMGAVFHTFFNVSPLWGILIGFSIIILYSSLGGMRAVVYTDILQFLVLVIGIPLTLWVGIHHVGGFSAWMQKIPPHQLSFLSNPQAGLLFASLFITFMLGETLVPPYVQRLFMAKTCKETQRGTLASGILSIPFFLIAGAIGLVAYAINPAIDANLALPYVVQVALPVVLRGFVIASILAIIMSSASGFLNAGAISFVNDMIRPLSRHRVNQTVLLRLAKSVTVFMGIGSVFFALLIKNVLDVLLTAYQFWAPIILVPTAAFLLGTSVKPRDFFIGASGGVMMLLIWSYGLHNPYHIQGIVMGVLGNLLFFTFSRWAFKPRPAPLLIAKVEVPVEKEERGERQE
ncbi:MAG: hypothetical protein A3F41_03690 [Coxiella sp. RIFCSPHIGHO2_12_FULL_44_14]|nr:MAG: hypothetical protein A3F41_03690 [Coxiella sp. RIFCSPHIGHO2_12_FULL_44_14]